MGFPRDPVRIVFLGTPPTAVPSLRALAAAGHEIPRVVTRPDRPAGRSGRPRPTPVKLAAERLGLTVDQPERIRRRGFREQLAELAPDLLVVVAYGKIFSRPLLELAPRGAINLHFSLLPAYRGAAPVQWALARGEQVTGVTTMQMSEGLDEGDVLLQREVAIEPGEHAPQLAERLAETGAELLVETLRALARGEIVPRAQDPSLASFAPQLTRADGEIDPGLPAGEIEGRVRGFDPWPGAWVRNGERRLRLVRARAADATEPGAAAGRVLALEGERLLVACGQGTVLAIERLQPEGRRVLAARDAVNGRQLVPGDRLSGGLSGA